MYSSEKLIQTALSYVGYLEKSSAKDLDDFTANAGRGNYTRFCRDYESYTKSKGFQPSQWCAEYVSCCVAEAFGVEAAKELLCGNLFASCTIGREQFRKCGQYHTENPRPGDIVVFYNSKHNGLGHCGIVTCVTKNGIETVEGNTGSGKNVVIDNGGAVATKSYRLNNSSIAGYCRMALDGIDPTSAHIDNKNIAAFQTWLNKEFGFALAVDGVYGKVTKQAATKALQITMNDICNARLVVDGSFGSQTKSLAQAIHTVRIGDKGVFVYLLQGLLACHGEPLAEFDGVFGSKTEMALFVFHKKTFKKNRSAWTKMCDANTWEALLK